MSTKIKLKITRFTTRIYWQKTGGTGIVTATLQIENGEEHELYKEGISIQRAEAVGEKLLQHLKAVYL